MRGLLWHPDPISSFFYRYQQDVIVPLADEPWTDLGYEIPKHTQQDKHGLSWWIPMAIYMYAIELYLETSIDK